MSNLLLLPQLSMTVTVVTNAGWYDSFIVPNPTGLPLDLTGLGFHSELRLAVSNPNKALDASTQAGTMTNSNTTGILGWAVPIATMSVLPPGQYVMDIVATDLSTNNQKSMFENGPAIVTVLQGVTR
jgi:hypothetical protein